MTGFENLKNLAKIQNKITDKEILDTLEDVCLLQEKDKSYDNYSLGMKQKLAIAQAIMEDPKVLILDEPFNGLDERSAEKIRNLFIEKINPNQDEYPQHKSETSDITTPAIAIPLLFLVT